jgi:HSP20 family protein
MALIRWEDRLFDPMRDYENLQNEINRLFNGQKPGASQGLFDRSISPAIDVLEDRDNIIILCDIPGVDMNDLELTITKDVLTIKGEKKEEEKKDKARIFKKETWEGSFQRTIALPDGVDSEKVDATLKDGVLRVVVPKMEEVKPRQIKVKS